MSRHGELLSLIQEIIECKTNVDLDELCERAYEYYKDDELSPSEYDHVIRLIQDL